MLLSKMVTQNGPIVRYQLTDGENVIEMNELIGKRITLAFKGIIQCQNCGRQTKKSYSQGYCFPCSQKLAECDICIVRPERCHYDEGTCREPEWGEQHCMQDHFVYLANSSGIKVGITRAHQIPTRWMDQGAIQATRIFKTESRHLAGLVEVAISSFITDKTNWRQMLKGEVEEMDLRSEVTRVLEMAMKNITPLIRTFGEEAICLIPDDEVFNFTYPVQTFPTNLVSHNFDKKPIVEGTLKGLKGQYLILDSGVLNIRKFTSYDVTLETKS